MKLKLLLPLLLVTGVASLAPAYADDAASRREAFCKNNPTTCEKMQEKKKECDANPQQCEQLKQERRARFAKMKAACDANPAECQKKKDAWRKRVDDRAAQQQAPQPQ